MSPTALRNTAQMQIALMTPNGKSSVVEPKLCDRDGVELSEILTSEIETTLNEDIMQLARLGDIQGIEKLFRSHKFDPSYSDEEGITPLHWAAINNQYSTCEFLLKEGADVNKRGGESVATPAMWAAQRRHYYTVNLLLKYGADPLATDIQGYNILHLATFEGSIFLLVLMLHQGIDVDIPDRQGHTCLMWAAYKGFSSCVDLFLRWGANVHNVDDTGFTALHWALVKGSQGCISKLIEYGSDRFAQTQLGKTPATTAHEMNTEQVWKRALKESGYDERGNPMILGFPMSNILMKNKRVFMNRFFFIYPVIILWAMMMIASHMVVFVGIPLSLFAGYCLQWFAQQMIAYAPSDMKKIHMTPWLAGIFAGTLFLVGLNWLTTLLPETYSTHTFTNLLFGTMYTFCAYFYSCTMIFDPGFVPKLGSLIQQKEVIDELLSIWKFDESNFCVPCMVRQPLRSKHCRQCKRCVAKHDHHCPWVFNCIGVKNHRHFLLYLISLEIGVMTLLKITIGYFEHRLSAGSNDYCYLLPSSFCQVVNADPYTLILVSWSILQLTWVTMLIFVQLTQISRGMTTWENMHGSHYDDPSKASEAIRSVLSTNEATSTSLQPEFHFQSKHHHHQKKGCFSLCKKVLGVDTFVETALIRKDLRQRRNPFSAGFLRNFQDFWCDPAPIFSGRNHGKSLLGGQVIDYTSMYEVPSMLTMRGRSGNLSTYERVAQNETHE